MIGLFGWRAEWDFLAGLARDQVRLRLPEPIHRLSDERRGEINPAPDLCGKDFEAFVSEDAGGKLTSLR